MPQYSCNVGAVDARVANTGVVDAHCNSRGEVLNRVKVSSGKITANWTSASSPSSLPLKSFCFFSLQEFTIQEMFSDLQFSG